MPLLPVIVALPTQAWLMQHIAEATRAYGQGGFAEVLAFRLNEISAILPLHFFIFPRTIALFLLGAFVWRTGILREIDAHTRLLGVLAAILLPVGLGLSALHEGLTPFNRSSLGVLLFMIERSAPVILALGYAATVLALIAAGEWRLFAWTAPLGRIAFTNYLLQSLIFGWIWSTVSPFAAFAFGAACAFAAALLLRAWVVPEAEA